MKTGDAAEEAWRASERRHAAKLREQRRRDWQDYFMRLADSLRASAREYDRKAEMLRETKGT